MGTKLDLLILVISLLYRFHRSTIGGFMSGEKLSFCAFGAWFKNVHQNKKDRLLEFSRMEFENRTLQNDLPTFKLKLLL